MSHFKLQSSSGSIDTIPAGWLLCDGTNETPDLRDKFIFGAGSVGSVGNHGPDGTSSGINTVLYGNGNDIYMKTNTVSKSDNSLREGGNSDVPGHSHNFMPRYYVLAFIMKE
ncbi:MAG: hypothetical protein ABIB11_02360 [Candidatus Omnitrophota bacterium]